MLTWGLKTFRASFIRKELGNKGSVCYSENPMEEVLSQVLSDVWKTGVDKVESDNQDTGQLFYDPNSHAGG